MPIIYNYFDYRKYMDDYYSNEKKKDTSFSYQSFTIKCGFKNKSFLHQIIHTTKKISQSSINGISKAIGHSKREARYFKALVAFNQARSLEEKNKFYEQLILANARSKKPFKGKLIRQDQFEYYSKWHHGAIRALIGMQSFKDDSQTIAHCLYPPIPVREVKKSIDLLERLEFIKKNSEGYYTVTDNVISTGDEVVSTAVLNFHRQTAKLASEAINKVPRNARNITGVMMGISPAGYQKIIEKLSAFRKEILSIAQNDEKASAVYQLNLHLFPLSNPKTMLSSFKKDISV
jgi:uncharacterized protein (TIGR02147 family)